MKSKFLKIVICVLVCITVGCALAACNFNKTIYLDYNYQGAQKEPVVIQMGSQYRLPTDAERQGYKFEGWYLDSACTRSYTNGTVFANNTTYYAKWKALPQSLQLAYNENLFVGDQFSKNDLTVTVVYADGVTKTTTDFTADLQNVTATAGTKEVAVSYTENDTTVQSKATLQVSEVQPSRLEVAYVGPALYEGDQLSAENVTVTICYNNGTTQKCTDFTLGEFDSSTAGQANLAVTAAGITQQLAITVKPVEITSITAEYVASYIPLNAAFSKDDFSVTVHYTNGNEHTVEDFSVENFVSTTVGQITLLITYNGATPITCNLQVDVRDPAQVANNLTVTHADYAYVVGESFKSTKLTVTAYYDDGHSEVLRSNQYTRSGFSSQKAGFVTVSVTYQGITRTVQVQILHPETVELQNIEVVYHGTNVPVGGKLNNSDFSVVASYSDGSTQQIFNFGIGAFSSAIEGTQAVEISYTENGITKSATVNVVVVSADAVNSGSLSIHFLEVGNMYTGDSVYIKAGDTDILIDAGSRAGSAATIGAYINKYCTDGVLEYVIATHAHQDHIAGFVGTTKAKGIFDAFECQTIIQFARSEATTAVYKDYCAKRDAEVANGAKLFTALECYNNALEGAQRVYNLTEDGSIKMEILYQKFYEFKAGEGGENDYSVCIMITQGENHYLLTGDLEAQGEKSLVQCNPDLPEMVLFKGGHHGSFTASSDILLSKIKPQIVCVCCCAGSYEYAKDKNHTFPAQEFIDRVAQYTDKVYVTTMAIVNGTSSVGFASMNGNIVFSCVNGTITMEFSNNDLKLKDTDWFKENRTCPDAWL